MKFKKILLILTSAILLSGCDFLESLRDQVSGGSSNTPSSEVINNNSSGNSSNNKVSINPNKPIDSTSDITDDDSIYEKDAYKAINLKTPNFSTRKINSKEEVVFEDLFNLGNKVSIETKLQ
jgi:hypothetical protein